MKVNVAGEGRVDVIVATRLLATAGLGVELKIETGGSGRLDQKLAGYQRSSDHLPWLILRDLDQAPCAPALLQRLGVRATAMFSVRIPVRAIEAWLLADDERLAAFLDVPRSAIPADPDILTAPKLAVVAAARRSRSKRRRDAMVPQSDRMAVGPGYAAALEQFATSEWRPDRARQRSASLERALRAVAGLTRRRSLA